MKHKLIIIYLILFILIGVVSVFILHHAATTTRTVSQKTIINTFVNEATFTEYNKKGLVKTTIRAQKITHYQPQGTTVFEKPFIITYSDNRTPWHIRADQATSDRTGQKIILTGHVTAHELPTAQETETMIKTTEITVFPKESRAETDKPVILTRPGATIYGTEFTANLKTGQYQLSSESKAIYQPEQKNKSPHQSP